MPFRKNNICGFENQQSPEQELTFAAAEKEFEKHRLPFANVQMKNLGLLNQDNIYTNLALLLSEQCPHTVRVAVFGDSIPGSFLDRRELKGSLLRQFNEICAYINVKILSQPTFERTAGTDTSDYPAVAVREALLNALIHRDYSFEASTLVNIYKNKIEIISIGGLPNGIMLEDILMGLSVCRNPELAELFYHLELLKAYGSGLRMIIDAYATSAVKPQFEVSANAFKVVLPNLSAIPEIKINPSGEISDIDTVRLLIKRNGSITRKEVEIALGVKQTTAGRILKQMQDEGFISQAGNGKGTYYQFP